MKDEMKKEEPVLTEEDLEDPPVWLPLLLPLVVAFVPQLVMLILKLTEAIDWQWWEVFLPTISAAAAVLFFLAIIVLKGLLGKSKKNKSSER